MEDQVYDITLANGRKSVVTGVDQMAGYGSVADIYTDTKTSEVGFWRKIDENEASSAIADPNLAVLQIEGKSLWVGPKTRAENFKIGAAIAADALSLRGISIVTRGNKYNFADVRAPISTPRKNQPSGLPTSATPTIKGEMHIERQIGKKNTLLMKAVQRLDLEGVKNIVEQGADLLAFAATEAVKRPTHEVAQAILEYLLSKGAGHYETILLELADMGDQRNPSPITELEAAPMVRIIMSFAPTKSDIIYPYMKFRKNGWVDLAKFLMLKVNAI